MAFGDYATFKDDFTGVDGTSPPSSSWSNSVVSSNGGLSITSATLSGVGVGVNSGWWNVATFGPDVEAYATVSTLPNFSNVFRIYARIATPNTAGVDAYFVQHTVGSSTNLFRLDNGSATSIASASITWQPADKVGIRCVGSAIEAWRHDGSSWSMIASATDATYSAAGYCGLGISNQQCRMDDFYAGTIGAAAASKPKSFLSLGIG